ncbi:MAG: CRTAC1 family protein [Acidobacteriota bacterium]|nr:CRTAC1 family protein [Acidobacteriota bacterium]
MLSTARLAAWMLLGFAAICVLEPRAHSDGGTSPIRFEDVATKSGIDFVLHNCPTTQKHMIETMAGGLAAFDYDGDGRPDVFFTNGADLPSLTKTGSQYWNRLYHNEGNMKFRDVTEQAGVAGEGYSMGAAAGDYDNDGHPDLFVAGVNRNILYHNLGNGRFEDVTAKAGITSGEWAVAAGWFDYDNDGRLDLWVVHYAKWSASDDRYCGDKTRNLRIYCHPKYFTPLASTLYHNRGDGTFEDVSKKSGISAFAGRGMSVAFADYDGDGYSDVFVTNDNMPNFLFHNRGNGTFEEVGLLAGVALREDGKAVASMGADFRDYDNDGLPDIAVTALAGETFPLFRNAGKGNFNDVTYSSKMGALTVHHSGWGTGLFDFNNDGWKDLFTSNSHVNDRVEMFESAVYKEPNSVFLNLGNGTFRDISAEAGQTEAKAHRGSAFADFDGDGKIDVVVSSLEQPIELWRNISPGNNHWLTLKLTGTHANRDALGAHIRVGDQWNDMTSAVSYASSTLDGVHFGLGSKTQVDRVQISWLGGKQQTLSHVKADQVLKVREPQ